MGAWGYGPFENDDAADWLDELIEASDIEVLRRALEPRWLDYVYMQVTKGSVIVAAAEVLAAGLGKGAADLPDDVKRWVRLNARLPYKTLTNVARAGLELVLGSRSELRSLWSDSGSNQVEWEKRIRELSQRVGG
jgi:hypothetical protein